MRRALLLLAVTALASCTRLDPEHGRRYLCARDAGGGASQCPANGAVSLHCGLEGVCLPDEPGAWRCATNDDCYGWHCGVEGVCYDLADAGGVGCRAESDCAPGWHCGVAGVCYDLANAGSVDCRSDGDCAPAWHCGVAGVCYDLANAGSVTCRGEDDCAPGWHCGVERVCYERATAQAVACRAAIAADCADGWRCGLNERCHDRDAGAPYACQADTDCERNWRCGLDGVCIDGALDALRPTGDAGGMAATRLTAPLWGVPKLVSVSDHLVMHYPESCSFFKRYHVESATVIDDAGLVRVLRYPLGKPVCSDAGTESAYLDDPEVGRAPLPVGLEDPIDVVDLGLESWVLGADGGLWRFTHQGNGPLAVDRIDAPFGPSRLHAGRQRAAPWPTSVAFASGTAPLLVFGGPDIARYELDGGWTRALPLSNTVIDVEEVGPNSAPVMTVLAVTEPNDGVTVYSAKELDGGWTQNELPRQVFGCEFGAGAPRIVEVRQPDAVGVNELHVLRDIQRPDGGHLWTLSVMTSDAGLPLATLNYPLPPIGSALTGIECVAHGGFGVEAFTVGDVIRGANDTDVAREAFMRLTPPDGGPRILVDMSFPSVVTGIEKPTPGATLADPALAISRTNSRRTAFAAEGGQLWVSAPRSITLFSPKNVLFNPIGQALPLEPWFLTAMPDGVTGTARTPFVIEGAQTLTTHAAFALVLPVESPSAAVFKAGVGFMSVWEPDLFGDRKPLQGAVHGQNWATTTATDVLKTFVLAYSAVAPTGLAGNKNRPSGAIAWADPPLPAPFLSATTPMADGGLLLTVASDDALYLADVTAVIPDGAPGPSAADWMAAPRLTVSAVPANKLTITSLTALPPTVRADGGVAYAEGFACARGRVFRYRAENPVVVRTDELVLGAAEVAEVWADGRRGRAGLRDGTVYSLPSRLLLAPAIAASASTVYDYESVCGHTFALARGGLYELRTQGAVTGTWEKVALASAPGVLSNGRLWTDGTELLVFLPKGVVERVSGIACLPPE